MLLVFLAVLVIMAMTLFDILSRDPALVRLPKPLWAILVILFPLIGSAIWFLVGRRTAPKSAPRTGSSPGRPGSTPTLPATKSTLASGRPPSTEEQLAALEREIAEDQRTQRIAELEAELRRRRGEPDGTA